MELIEILEKKKMSKYRLAKASGIPYSTLSDILNGKTELKKCSAETVYRLAKELGVSMEELLASSLEYRCSFDNFKSNVCHKLKAQGDIDFLIDVLERDDILKYYNRKWYPESLYLLAMVDYLSRVNDVPLCTKYDSLRKAKLSQTVYPSSVIALAIAMKSNEPKRQAEKESIPEFMRFNIVESEVRNVI